jgi:DNA-binding CsgD family transcriptional regulator
MASRSSPRSGPPAASGRWGINVDRGDDDPVVFLSYLSRALNRLAHVGPSQDDSLPLRRGPRGRRLARGARRNGHLFRGARWINADINLRGGSISLDLGDRNAARERADDARAALHGYPDPGTLPTRLAQLDERIAHATDLGLTPAEPRIAGFLPTHRSLREIAETLSLSRATVKTHVAAIYAKLGVATRSKAVERMAKLGIEPTVAKCG